MKKFFSEKAKDPKICLSLGGSMPEAQIKQCPLTPSPNSVVVVARLATVKETLDILTFVFNSKLNIPLKDLKKV